MRTVNATLVLNTVRERSGKGEKQVREEDRIGSFNCAKKKTVLLTLTILS